ncbi:MAG: thioredoxin domain-containing protein, partial [Acidobacteria bacterium]|nr:thioredoxin domain-containing protein [Acidobacteriota bacterium]
MSEESWTRGRQSTITTDPLILQQSAMARSMPSRIQSTNYNHFREINSMQNNLIRKSAGMLFAFLALMALMIVPAMAKTKPTVAIIKADWCSACQKLEPTMLELMKEYGDKVEFVMLDVTSDEKVAESQATAKKLGLGN